MKQTTRQTKKEVFHYIEKAAFKTDTKLEIELTPRQAFELRYFLEMQKLPLEEVFGEALHLLTVHRGKPTLAFVYGAPRQARKAKK